MPIYNRILDRIIQILEYDETLQEKITSIRKGDLGDSGDARFTTTSYPFIYVTTPSAIETERKQLTAQSNINELPAQMLTHEFWVVIVVQRATPQETQEELYNLSEYVMEILEKNIQLKDPETLTNPLAITSEVFFQKRYEEYRGAVQEAGNIRILTKSVKIR